MDKLIVIRPDGSVESLYDDCLHALGRVHGTARASHVEPGENGWDVVLTDDPRNGKWRGHVVGRGYLTRKEALDAEVAFINANILRRVPEVCHGGERTDCAGQGLAGR